MKINQFYRNQKGNTLIEMVIYMGLMSILLVVLAEIFGMVRNFDLEYRSFSSIHQEGRFIINKLDYDIKNAESITTPSGIGDSSNSLVIVSNSVSNTYALTNGKLTLNDGTGTYDLNDNNTNITSISFQRIGNPGGKNSIKVDFTIETIYITRGENRSKNFSSTISLR